MARLLGSDETPMEVEESPPSDSQQTARAIAGDSWLLRGMRRSKLSARQLLREHGALFRLRTNEPSSTGTKRDDGGAFEVRVNLQELAKRLRLASKQRVVPSATEDGPSRPSADNKGQLASAAQQAPTAETRVDATEPEGSTKRPHGAPVPWSAAKRLVKALLSHSTDGLLMSIASTRVGAALVAT